MGRYGIWTIQSLLFNKKKFTPAQAEEWAAKHLYKHDKVHSTEDFVRLRQIPPGKFRPKSFRTIHLKDGDIEAVYGRLL